MNEKPKIPEIPFNNEEAYFQLVTKNEIYTLRSKRFPNRIHYATHKKKKLFAVHVRFVKEVEICETTNNIPNFLICKPLNALDKYVGKSGFYDVSAWLQALPNFRYNIPSCPQTRTFYLHKATKI